MGEERSLSHPALQLFLTQRYGVVGASRPLGLRITLSPYNAKTIRKTAMPDR
jgi:hypothetical protein